MKLSAYLSYAGKAVIAGGIAAAGTVATSLSDGHLSGSEWALIVGATLAAVGGVFGYGNGPKP